MASGSLLLPTAMQTFLRKRESLMRLMGDLAKTVAKVDSSKERKSIRVC